MLKTTMAAARYLLTSVCMCVLGILFLTSFEQRINLEPTILVSGIVFFSSVVILITVFKSLDRASPHLALSTTLYLFLSNLKARHDGLRALKMFLHNCKDVYPAQQKLLRDIIHKNSATDYGRKFGIGTILSLEDLRKRHPLTNYDHYESFVQRVAQGEPHVMTRDPPTRFCRSNGTTGNCKLVPQDGKKLLPKVRAVLKGVMHENFPKMTSIQRIMKLYIHVNLDESKCGIPMTSVTAIDPKVMKYMVSYTTPPEGLLLNTLFDALYIHLLFGLRERSLGVIEASFIMTVEEAIRILMSEWENLVEDLKTGTIYEGVHLEPNMRSALSKALGNGDVARANEVEVEIRKGPIGIVKRLWPNIAFIGCIDNLGRKPYLQTTFAAGEFRSTRTATLALKELKVSTCGHSMTTRNSFLSTMQQFLNLFQRKQWMKIIHRHVSFMKLK
ncbi:putative indole-3-acetic acid-amido synthetase GH3.2 [Holothuria leucospilota]|uniref:Indole-3-acetic acid-amido synthetase GH3.2 n=1 Tax=Holothuria leucospilota TaxID=206669 RepID=A0A9Q1CC12_HOLLE|nr:putative indole-3-acetic acid-amido synthetase GH3.2 [Holothuria leucospilota]